MPASKTDDLTRVEVLAAVRSLPKGQDYVSDGADEHPAALEGLQAGIVADLNHRGRPKAEAAKERIALRL